VWSLKGAEMVEPRELADRLEQGVELPDGEEERFAGYGVMGLPFKSGHVLCLRRFPVSSLGKGYSSVWHRDPEGRWVFIQDVQPQMGCSRYFGSAVDRSIVGDIRIAWTGDREFIVRVEGDYVVEWTVRLDETMSTMLMNAFGSMVPSSWWRSPLVLGLMGRAGGFVLGAGRLNLTGRVPNGQRFVANPRYVWVISDSEARVQGRDLGPPGPLAVQARLGDLWLPLQGRFFAGNAFLEAFDPARHLSAVSRGT